MPVILEDYQVRVVNALTKTFSDAVRGVPDAPTAAVLKAPTASGKTVMLARGLSEISAGGAPTVWFWLAPFDNIIGQTERTIRSEAGEALTPKHLRDRTYGGHRSGDVWLSTAALASSSKAGPAEDTEFSPSLRTMAAEIRATGMRVGVVIDEAHLNAKQKGRFIEAISLVSPDVIFAATATPNDPVLDKFFAALGVPAVATITVDRAEAVERHLNKEGLWARLVSASGAGQQVKLDMLVRATWARNVQIQAALTAAELDITPLALFQADNKAEGERMLEAVRRVTGLSEKEVAFYDSESKSKGQRSLNVIADDPEVKALVFKVAAGTGFDAPRAFCLGSARTVRDETSAAQFVGRTMRVPRALRAFLFANPDHPARGVLNNAHLFLLDDEAQTGFKSVVAKVSGSFAAAGLTEVSVKKTTETGEDIDDVAPQTRADIMEILRRSGEDGEGYEDMDAFEDALGVEGVELLFPRSAAFDRPMPREEWRQDADLSDYDPVRKLKGAVITPQRVRDRLERANAVFDVVETGDDVATEQDEDEVRAQRWRALRAAKADLFESFSESVSMIPGLSEPQTVRVLLAQMSREVADTGFVSPEDTALASRIAMLIASEFHGEMKTAATKGEGAGRVMRNASPLPDAYLLCGPKNRNSKMAFGYYVQQTDYVEPPADIMGLLRDLAKAGMKIGKEFLHLAVSDKTMTCNQIETHFLTWAKSCPEIVSVFRNPQGKSYSCSYVNLGGVNQTFYPDFVVVRPDGGYVSVETKYDRKDLVEKMAGRNESDASLRVKFVVLNPANGMIEEFVGHDEQGREICVPLSFVDET